LGLKINRLVARLALLLAVRTLSVIVRLRGEPLLERGAGAVTDFVTPSRPL
jgi:hypothetical protein